MRSLLQELESEIYVFELTASHEKIINSENLDFQKINDTTFSVKIDKVNNLNKVLTYFSQNNIEIQSMTNETNRLEELFLSLTK